VDDQVKAISERCHHVEEQLARSTRYVKREESDEGIILTRAWFNGVGDLLKVAIEKINQQARELTEYTAIDTDSTYDGLHVFTLKEVPAADGGTDVEETRRYYGEAMVRDRFGPTRHNGLLIRELKRSAHFAPGEPLDMAKKPERRVSAEKRKRPEPEDEASEARSQIFDRPGEIAEELRAAGAPEEDPFAEVEGDSARFRLIRGSASPDGRYAMAIGFDQPVEWGKYADTSTDEQEVYTADDAEELRNFVVELATKKILGVTGGFYFGTRQRYNLRESLVVWSEDSSTFVQKYQSKWEYESCHAGRVGLGPKLIGVVNLGEAAERHAQSFLKRKRRSYDGSIALSVVDVKADGTIVVLLTGQESSVPNRGHIYFQLEQTFRLVERTGKLQLDLKRTRLLPND
jgi:hypothetical protein